MTEKQAVAGLHPGVPYDRDPQIEAAGHVETGTAAIVAALQHDRLSRHAKRIVIDCFPGVDQQAIRQLAEATWPNAEVVNADDFAIAPAELTAQLAQQLTDDRVFGRLSHQVFADFFPETTRQEVKTRLDASDRQIVVIGCAASLFVDQPDLLLYADITRWQLQLRLRAGQPNWHATNGDEDMLRKYKRGYFFEWRLGDRQRNADMPRLNWYLDTTARDAPRLASAATLAACLDTAAHRPFRLVPYFDQSVWGGQWMKQQFALDPTVPNYGWAFDGVPEENSLKFALTGGFLRVPAIALVHQRPMQLLGALVQARFGNEFPLRFDYLDTMGGGNLSLQVHPRIDYIQDKFGMTYTQSESYYILEAGEGASVYLGVKNGCEKGPLFAALHAAQETGQPFDDTKFINRFPAHRGDHFSIPAGTIHSGGANTVILEISQTPYIFTFKLWDWGRIGLDGRPRPVHLAHGEANANMAFDEDFARRELIDPSEPVVSGDGHQEEHTGLQALEFIETRRHHLAAQPSTIDAHHGVNMLNLVSGTAIRVESLTDEFPAQTYHFGETFIVPATIGAYRVVNLTPTEPAILMQAFVREQR
ncbi:class I mannose-6-phosphate isomerase [Lacticaseibacillus yichunensis]|uniref:Class I mannose-6-phosphate isomerase n=1 Tax=Lacticaseibacillus yichunensis TaxID=2486015 RepID=A0ABW4CUE5_9LACO|nr:class I mannose-6-phosphate isomerase [Lacticaseibacillus yichunensis]